MKKSAGVVGGLCWWGSGALTFPLKSGLAAERSQSKSQMSGAERWTGFKKSNGAWAGGRRSGNGAGAGLP